ncbi:unnamed protein product, partial [Tenebrio molitor]
MQPSPNPPSRRRPEEPPVAQNHPHLHQRCPIAHGILRRCGLRGRTDFVALALREKPPKRGENQNDDFVQRVSGTAEVSPQDKNR